MKEAIEVVIEEDLLDYGEDENSSKVSLASITCIRQTLKEDASTVLNKGIVHKKEVQPPIVQYNPPPLRNNGTICNSQDGKPMISLAGIIGRVEPRTLKLKRSIKSKNIIILVDSRSTHNFVDINLAKKINIFVYLVRDLMVTIVDVQ